MAKTARHFEMAAEFELEPAIFRIIVEAMVDLVYICSQDYRILYANPAMIARNGRHITGEICHRAFHDLETACPWCRNEKVWEGQSCTWEMQNPKDGSSFQILNVPIHLPDGALAKLAIIQDITERREAERRLRQSRIELIRKNEELKVLFKRIAAAKEEWERTMDCVGDMVMLAGNDGAIVRCNRAVCDFAGKSFPEVLGRDWKELLQEIGILTPGLCGPGRELYHEKCGRWFVFNAYPFTDSTNYEISGVVITIHDTTELKKTAEALSDAYRELQTSQARVLQQEKMASIGQLAAGVAHEINNPIGFITSNLGTLKKYAERLTGFIQAQEELLAQEQVEKRQKEQLEEQRQQLKIDRIAADLPALIDQSLDGADRVKRIVQNLKSFARVDESEHKHANINECLESTLNIVWNELKYKATVVRKYGEIPRTRCYPQQLNQVFMNLLLNAAQAIEGQGEITLRTWADDRFIHIRVADTGCSIPVELQERIFEPFFTTKEVGKGTGLGLSIAYDIIRKHKGEISLDSTVGKGSAFTVTIPIVEE